MDFDWKIKGGHYQKQTIQNDNLLILEDTTITKNGITLTIKDGVITIDGTSTASTNIDFKIKKKLKAGTYRHMVKRDSGSANGNISFLIMKSSGSVSTMNGSGGANFTLEEDTEVFYRIWTNKNNIISNVAYKCLISEGSDSKPWVQGIPDSPSVDYPSEIETVSDSVKIDVLNNDNTKSQSAIMPIQQEMLTGDYIKDVEHHEWGEYMLTGNETNISRSGSVNGITQFNIAKIVYKNPNTEEITARSNYFLGVKWDKSWTIDNCICNTTDGYSIRIMTSEYTTVEDFKTWLKSKYDEGSPVIIYYKLAIPVNLELTSEQKAVRNQKLHTYKNITNISLSDELASIDVEYKRDLETMFNNIIKQMPSNTSDTGET